MLRVGTSTLIFGTLLLANVANAETDCTKVLVPKVTQFESSTEKWLALVNLSQMTSDRQGQSTLGLGYAGFNLSGADAQALSSFYQQRTQYSLAESDTISIATTEVPFGSVQAFVECVKNSRQDITISAPSGAESQQAFQIKVSWTPTYNPVVKEGTTDRTANVNITNGTLVSPNDKVISPTGSVPFNITRQSLDKPIFISASIDGRESDFFSFPARPQSGIVLTWKPVDSPMIQRSAHAGTEAASLPFCLPPVSSDSEYLSSTVSATVTGAGYQWKERSSINVSQASPLSICAMVNAGGVACGEAKCAFYTVGHLGAALASIVKIDYAN
jgi:hypothetical protein